jgi:thiomorpholine-carboxylate dehydrogenase
MPGYSEGDNGLGAKIVTMYPGNTEKGLPSHNALILLFHPETGIPQAIVEGEEITAMRTAAASAVAAKYLARPSSSVLCILGSGVQARSHFEAMMEVMKISQVRIWSRTAKNAAKFGDEVRQVVKNTVVCGTAEEAASGADVVVTVTGATEPILQGKWVKEGAAICAVGAPRKEWRELDNEVMKNSLVTVDSSEAAVKESGDIVQSGAEIYAEIGELVNKTKSLPPDHGKKFLLFKSLGVAIEDIVSARLVFQKDAESTP